MYVRILRRFMRVTVGIVIAGLTAKYADNPVYLALSPILAAIGKWLREKGFNFPVPI